MSDPRPTLDVAVVMRRERVLGRASRWQTWRWVLAEVVQDDAGFGTSPRLLLQNDEEERWLHPGFKVELLVTDAEGYYLNITTQKPCWFVLWRMEEVPDGGVPAYGAEPIPLPQIVTLSYHDAGRWLDAQETVEQVAAPTDVINWLGAFVDEHHVLETKRRRRPESFKSLVDRFGNPATVSTQKSFGGAAPGHEAPAVPKPPRDGSDNSGSSGNSNNSAHD